MATIYWKENQEWKQLQVFDKVADHNSSFNKKIDKKCQQSS